MRLPLSGSLHRRWGPPTARSRAHAESVTEHNPGYLWTKKFIGGNYREQLSQFKPGSIRKPLVQSDRLELWDTPPAFSSLTILRAPDPASISVSPASAPLTMAPNRGHSFALNDIPLFPASVASAGRVPDLLISCEGLRACASIYGDVIVPQHSAPAIWLHLKSHLLSDRRPFLTKPI